MRRVRHALAALAAAGTLAFLWAPSAAAHVRVSADNAPPGGYATLVFSVPNESETHALTTELTVQLPATGSASAETVPGWTSTVERDATRGTVRSITWKAFGGNGIGPDQFGLFRIRLKLPDTDSVSFPATQVYSDGQVVKWDQPSSHSGAEPERPAPVLELATAQSSSGEVAGRTDIRAQWFGVIGMVLAAAALVLAVTASRASSASGRTAREDREDGQDSEPVRKEER